MREAGTLFGFSPQTGIPKLSVHIINLAERSGGGGAPPFRVLSSLTRRARANAYSLLYIEIVDNYSHFV
jgi:hypothetical protein